MESCIEPGQYNEDYRYLWLGPVRVAASLGLAGTARRLERVTDEFARYRDHVAWLNGLVAFSMGVQFLRLLVSKTCEGQVGFISHELSSGTLC
mgnify:CR=1 FL=1